MLLEAKGVCKRFGGLEVLKNVDLAVNAGDAAVIVGPSGAGKTTLLRCLNFLETADAGTLTFENDARDMLKMTKKEIRA